MEIKLQNNVDLDYVAELINAGGSNYSLYISEDGYMDVRRHHERHEDTRDHVLEYDLSDAYTASDPAWPWDADAVACYIADLARDAGYTLI